MRWKVPNMWEGGECWILGGGPSLLTEFNIPQEVRQKVLNKELPLSACSPYIEAIHDKHVIGVNVAYLLGNWVDMMFFGDPGFFLEHREQLLKFSGVKVTCESKHAGGRFKGENIKYLGKNKKHGRGISPDARFICWNQNSGAAAISVAANTGAKRIILVGFDMQLAEDNTQHWHGEYKLGGGFGNAKKLPFHRHLKGFAAIKKDANKRGITILNASPQSTIPEFKKVTVKEALSWKATEL